MVTFRVSIAKCSWNIWNHASHYRPTLTSLVNRRNKLSHCYWFWNGAVSWRPPVYFKPKHWENYFEHSIRVCIYTILTKQWWYICVQDCNVQTAKVHVKIHRDWGFYDCTAHTDTISRFMHRTKDVFKWQLLPLPGYVSGALFGNVVFEITVNLNFRRIVSHLQY